MKIMLDKSKGAIMPERGYATDAGLDLKTPVDVTIFPKSSAIIDTGVHIQLPSRTVGMLKSKSGLNVKFGINSEGVIDEGYTGSIVAKLYNHSDDTVFLHKGDKVTQLVILPVIIPTRLDVVESLENTDRGNNGFGSTGR